MVWGQPSVDATSQHLNQKQAHASEVTASDSQSGKNQKIVMSPTKPKIPPWHFITKEEEGIATAQDWPPDNTRAKQRMWTITQEYALAAMKQAIPYNNSPYRKLQE